MPVPVHPPEQAHRRAGQLRCLCSQPVTLALVKVAGSRWTVEENFQASNGLTGLDEHLLVRPATPGDLAAAALSIAAAHEHVCESAPPELV
jgi:hypothetical protein